MAVDVRDLTAEQRDRLARDLVRQLRYFDALLRRMKQRGWYSTDLVRTLVEGIHASLRSTLAAIREAERLPAAKAPTKPPDGSAPRWRS